MTTPERGTNRPGSLITRVKPAADDAPRPWVLLLPGMSGHLGNWARVLEELRDEEFEIGFGAPLLSHEVFVGEIPTVTEFGRAIATEISGRGARGPVVVASQSVGAFPAFVLAADPRVDVAAVIAVNGGLMNVARFIDSPAREFLRHPADCLVFMRLFALVSVPAPHGMKRAIARHELATRLFVGNLVPRAMLSDVARRSMVITEAGRLETLVSLWKNRHHWHEFVREAAAVTSPTTFVVGEVDPMATAHEAELMARMFPSAEVEVLPGIGHAAPLEAPRELAEMIRAAVRAAQD